MVTFTEVLQYLLVGHSLQEVEDGLGSAIHIAFCRVW